VRERREVILSRLRVTLRSERLSLILEHERGALVPDASAINLHEYADARDIAAGFAAWPTVRDRLQKTTTEERPPSVTIALSFDLG